MKVWKAGAAAAALLIATSGCTTIVRSSVASNGAAPNAASSQAGQQSISDDGRYVIFTSPASDLVPNDTNGAPDVFRHDNVTGSTIRVSVTNAGAQIGGASVDAALSASGDDIAFRTSAGLESSDTNEVDDIYVRTVSTGKTERVSLRPDGTSIMGSSNLEALQNVSMSDDGRRVLMVQSQPAAGNIFLRDRTAGTSTVLGGTADHVLLSGDGTSMVETVLCTGGPCPHRTFITPVTLTPPPVEIDTGCGFRAFDVSSDARYVVGERFGVYPTFTCDEPTGLVRWDRTTTQFTKVPISIGLAPMVSISNDGRFVVSNGQDLVVRIADLATGVVQTPDADTWGQPGPGPSFGAAISGNGRYVAFTSNSKLVPGDTDTNDDVYTRYAIHPTVSSVAPTSVARGASHLSLTVTGAEFLPGATVAVAGTGVTVNSVSVQSSTVLKVDVSSSAGAAVGARNVMISNTGGFGHSDALCASCLAVT